MKPSIRIVASLLLAAGAAMPAFAATDTAAGKPSIAVIEFKNETNAGWWGSGVGRDLAGMLSNELADTGSFRVVERQKIENVLEEQNLMASGRAKPSEAAQMGKLTGAQYMVMGTVTSYEENTKSTGGGLSFRGISLGGKSESAYVAVDVRVVDTTTGEVVFTRTIEGTSKGGGMSVGVFRGGWGGNLASQEHTPAGKAIRAALIMISDYLDCVMVQKDGCEAKFDEADKRRRDKTSSALKLD